MRSLKYILTEGIHDYMDINERIKNIIVPSILISLFLSTILSWSSFSQPIENLSTNNDVNTADELNPSCELTIPTVQGPYYKEGSPIRNGTFFEGNGDRLILTGQVMNFIDCKPIKGAILDFWQADSNGKYDNTGFNLRGKIVTGENGNYKLDTIIPGSYSAGNITRPAHLHVKAWIPDNPGNPQLVTQLYFENDPHRDAFVKDPLILKITQKNGTKFANFDFVLEDYRNFGK